MTKTEIEIRGNSYENDNGKNRDVYDFTIYGDDNPHLVEVVIKKQCVEGQEENIFTVSVEDLYLSLLPYYLKLQAARKDANGGELNDYEKELLA